MLPLDASARRNRNRLSKNRAAQADLLGRWISYLPMVERKSSTIDVDQPSEAPIRRQRSGRFLSPGSEVFSLSTREEITLAHRGILGFNPPVRWTEGIVEAPPTMQHPALLTGTIRGVCDISRYLQ